MTLFIFRFVLFYSISFREYSRGGGIRIGGRI